MFAIAQRWDSRRAHEWHIDKAASRYGSSAGGPPIFRRCPGREWRHLAPSVSLGSALALLPPLFMALLRRRDRAPGWLI